MIKVGSLFSGIGGMEIGLSRSIPDAAPVWFCEKEEYPRSILRKHWSGVPIYDDVKNINKSNVESIDILTGGFPCQSISLAGKLKGLEDEEKSGLWWEMWRIISDLRPRIVIMENVANVIRLGGTDVVGSLAEIGYCVEWEIVSARQMGAPHLRRRWFAVAYPERYSTPNEKEAGKGNQTSESGSTASSSIQGKRGIRIGESSILHNGHDNLLHESTNPDGVGLQKAGTEFKTTRIVERRKLGTPGQKPVGIVTDPDGIRSPKTFDRGIISTCNTRSTIQRRRPSFDTNFETYWTQNPNPEPTICRLDDGIPDRVARLKALGNAIVPACSEYVGRCIVESGLIDDLISGGE